VKKKEKILVQKKNCWKKTKNIGIKTAGVKKLL